MLILFLLSSFAVQATWDGKPIPAKNIPSELRGFVEPQTVLISFNATDLNGDELSDYVVVLQKQKRRPDEEDIEEGQRLLLLIIRQNSGTLKVAKRNDKIVYCSTCGGAFGDPLESIDVGPKTFTVNHYGGSSWRWSNSFKFNYSRRDSTWQLVRVQEVSFHASDPDKTMKTEIYTPPKHYGIIDIADFDPENFRGKGTK